MHGAVQVGPACAWTHSSLLCLSLNQVGLQLLEKARPLEFFLCPSVNTNLAQFNMCRLYPWRSMDVNTTGSPLWISSSVSTPLYTLYIAPRTPGMASDGVTAHQNSRRWFLAGTVPEDILELSQQTLPDVYKLIQNCFHQWWSTLFIIPFTSLFGEHLSNQSENSLGNYYFFIICLSLGVFTPHK